MSLEKNASLTSFIEKAKEIFQGQAVDNNASDLAIKSCGYVLGKEIGRGSYSTVKLAYSEPLKTVVAVKIISKKTAPATYLERFLPREIDIIKRLQHKNILKYYQCIETTQRYLIAMEFAENGNILQLLNTQTYFKERLAHKFFGQLMSAVAYCHQFNVVHRDLKLENLMLDTRNELKLGDFGFCRKFKKQKKETMKCLSQTYCGSHAYASPEILNFTPYDPKMSDIWACGVILYSMVYGCFPFDDRVFSKLLILIKNPLQFCDYPVVSDECKDLLRKLMAPIDDRLDATRIETHPWMLLWGADCSIEERKNDQTAAN